MSKASPFPKRKIRRLNHASEFARDCFYYIMLNSTREVSLVSENYKLPDPLITVSPDWLGGEPVFTGRRVAVRTLFDYLESGETLSEFLEDFPSVSREHAIAVLKASKAAIVLHAVEQEEYSATSEELAAIDEALDQFASGQRASRGEVEAAFARFRK